MQFGIYIINLISVLSRADSRHAEGSNVVVAGADCRAVAAAHADYCYMPADVAVVDVAAADVAAADFVPADVAAADVAAADFVPADVAAADIADVAVEKPDDFPDLDFHVLKDVRFQHEHSEWVACAPQSDDCSPHVRCRADHIRDHQPYSWQL
jgi:uncharacterized protein YjbI with pentapeptide repeats